MSSLADWAEAHRALNEVIQLPLSTLEEEASISSPALHPFFNSLNTENAAWQARSQFCVGCSNACLQGGERIGLIIQDRLCCKQMLVDWLRKRMQQGKPAGRYLVLLYLMRGRVPEALSTHRELLNSLSEGQRAGVAVSYTAWHT